MCADCGASESRSSCPPTYDAIKVPKDDGPIELSRTWINHNNHPPVGPTYLHQLTWQWVCVVRNYCYDGPSPYARFQYCSCGLSFVPLGCAKSVVKLRARLGIQWIVDLSGPSSHHHLSFWNVSHAITVLSWQSSSSAPCFGRKVLFGSDESAKRDHGA